MRNRYLTIATVLALVLMPCAKISAAYAKSVSQTLVAWSETAELVTDRPADASADTAASASEQKADAKCTICCKQGNAVLSRPEAVVASAGAGKLVAVIWRHQDPWPPTSPVLTGLGARSPPQPTGTAFEAFFAKTSRFLS